MNPSIGQWLIQARDSLASGCSESPALDAEVILACALRKSRAWVLAHRSDEMEEDVLGRIAPMLARRMQGVPIAYITGFREFWSMPIKVTPDVLIPRPETELLVESALDVLPKGPVSLLDLGTGSGAIALALARERPDATLLAVDRSKAALKIAQANAKAQGIETIRFLESDWFAAIHSHDFDLVVANPPYVDGDDSALDGEVRYEPREALVAADEGLAEIRRIVAESPRFLGSGGWLVVEHGCSHGRQVSGLFAEAGMDDIAVLQDLAGLDRVTRGRIGIG